MTVKQRRGSQTGVQSVDTGFRGCSPWRFQERLPIKGLYGGSLVFRPGFRSRRVQDRVGGVSVIRVASIETGVRQLDPAPKERVEKILIRQGGRMLVPQKPLQHSPTMS